jgi:hypothetical protein
LHLVSAVPKDALSDALERLYAAPLDRFVVTRRELVASLRAAGELPASRLVATAQKPTRSAWALNEIARRAPQLVRSVFEARDAAAAAQKRGDAEQMRTTAREYRERISEVVHAARDVLAKAGAETNASLARRMAETVQAAGAGREDVRAHWLAGRLTHDVDIEDPFAGLEVGPSHARGPSKEPKRRAFRAHEPVTRTRVHEPVTKARAYEPQTERAIENARQRVASLEQAANDARAASKEAESVAARAQSEATRARKRAEDAEARLEQARAQLAALTK